MFTATKYYKWEMAHLLENHKGLCNNLHGHSYRMAVTLQRHGGALKTPKHAAADASMVMDFGDMSRILKEELVDKLDHCVMINENSTDEFEQDLLALCRKYGKKYYTVGYRPTAEEMSLDFFVKIEKLLEDRKIPCRVVSVKIFETVTSVAEYSEAEEKPAAPSLVRMRYNRGI